MQDLTGNSGLTPSLFNSLLAHPMPDQVKFTDNVPVRIRSLASLRHEGMIPARIGLLKIDTEGWDLDVINGMGESDVAVVMAEFWDGDHLFGRMGHGRLGAIVEAMRDRGYGWHIVIYHTDEDKIISFYLNGVDTMPGSWGNALFFRDRQVFVRAAEWCEAVLAQTILT